MQTTNETTNTDTETARKGFGIHAVLKHKVTGELSTRTEGTRTDLTKHLRDHCSDYEVIYVFRGRLMNVKRQTHFTLN